MASNQALAEHHSLAVVNARDAGMPESVVVVGGRVSLIVPSRAAGGAHGHEQRLVLLYSYPPDVEMQHVPCVDARKCQDTACVRATPSVRAPDVSVTIRDRSRASSSGTVDVPTGYEDLP
jgi:hypothetical protein